MAKLLSFEEAIIATARQKLAAARSRSGPRDGAEKPKEAISDALTLIAGALAPEGYAFRKTPPRLKREQGDLAFEIFFQSDRNNIAGTRAAVWIHAGVSSQILAEWRRNHASPWIRQDGPDAGRIAGAQIGNLNAVRGWMEWDFADKCTRRASCEDAINTIRDTALPFFETFNNPEQCLETLTKNPTLWIVPVIGYALSNGEELAAQKAIRLYLNSNPPLRDVFEAARSDYISNGLPKFHTSSVNELAAFVVAAGIDLE